MQFIDLGAQQERIKDKLDERIQSVLKSGKYIMGPEVKELEDKLGEFCGVKHVIGCANGTDALMLALKALGVQEGDAVFCPSFTFASTAEMVPLVNGATPVLVDIDVTTYNICVDSLERSIAYVRSKGLRPRGVIAVDLFGLPADYDAINAIAQRESLWIMADSAQGFGATYKGQTTGSIGDIATTSFFPAKPLGCYGDGGAIFTNDDKLADLLRSLRVHGKGGHKYDNERLGHNSRLDTIQAAILLEKLAIYADEIEKRQIIAERYTAMLESVSNSLTTPYVPDDMKSVWAQYTLQAESEEMRDGIMTALKEAGIPSVVYYPRPLHQQTAYKCFPTDPEELIVSERVSKCVFSLPMHPYLEASDQQKVTDTIKQAIG